MKKSKVVDSLIKIIRKYDIVTVQEIRDSSEKAFPMLVDKLNKDSGKEDTFDYIVSSRLGRTNSKEQYGFIFRTDRVKALKTFQYEGTSSGVDEFEREPFAVLFHVDKAEVEEFSLVSVHTKPTEAAIEVGRLDKVYDAVKKRFNNPNAIIAGDYNSDCKFVQSDDWTSINLWTDKKFYWAISRCQDTTTTRTDCAYDRFVLAGDKLKEALVVGSAKVVHFDKELGLTDKETLQVSDHYPIELLLSGKPIRGVQTNLDTYIAFTIKEENYIEDASALYNWKNIATERGSDIAVNYDKNGKIKEIVLSQTRIQDVGKTFERLQTGFPNVISESLVRAVHTFAKSDAFINPYYVYGLKDKVNKTYELEIRCKVKELECIVTAYHKNS